jgi:hypothetical protein
MLKESLVAKIDQDLNGIDTHTHTHIHTDAQGKACRKTRPSFKMELIHAYIDAYLHTYKQMLKEKLVAKLDQAFNGIDFSRYVCMFGCIHVGSHCYWFSKPA